jgi:hypothetical protein
MGGTVGERNLGFLVILVELSTMTVRPSMCIACQHFQVTF